MTEIRNRHIWIDIARLFSMLMIIVGHTPCYESKILAFITTFHVAIFFILSGYLYHPQTFKKEVFKSFQSLIIPYIILGMINCIYWGILYAYTNNTSINNNLLLFVYQLLTTSIGLPMIGPLWFLIVLFLLRISMTKSYSYNTFLILTIIAFFSAYYINVYFRDYLYFAPFDYFLALPFFVMGRILQKKESIVKKAIAFTIKTRVIISLFLFILSIIVFLYQGGNNMSKHDYGTNIFTFYICAVCCSLAIFLLSTIIRSKSPDFPNILHTLNNGLPLMIGLQMMMIDLAKHITRIYAYHITGSLILSFSIILIIYPLTILSMKFFPSILGKRK